MTAWERLRKFIQDNQHGNCHILSKGDSCECPLCDLDRLLHGDGEKGEERKQGHSRLVYDKETRSIKRVDDQPSPTPSRQEWDVWANYLADAICFSSDRVTLIKRIILSMPIVPKVDEEDLEEIQGQIEREEL